MNIVIKQLSLLSLLVCCYFSGCNNETPPADDQQDSEPTTKTTPDDLGNDELGATFAVKNIKQANGEVEFEFHFVKDKKALDHRAFLEAMAQNDDDYALKAMRSFARVITKYKLDQCGFSTESDPSKENFFWHIRGKQAASCNTAINPQSSYNANNAYKNILQGAEHAANRVESRHAFGFNSQSMTPGVNIRRLMIPKGPYVTLWNFANKASSEEIADFFRLTKQEVERLFFNANRPFTYEVHTGSNYAQAVPHFHLRVYSKS